MAKAQNVLLRYVGLLHEDAKWKESVVYMDYYIRTNTLTLEQQVT